MQVRLWGTRGSIPAPGHRTAIYGGNTSCVEVRTEDGTTMILDCGTGIRPLGLDMLSRPGPQRIHLLIGHTHWDHIQGFPFFTPAFLPASELNIYGSAAFQRSLEDSLSGQMQYSYFPVKLQDLASRIHYTELEEGFFRIGDVLVETQYLNHTAPTIAYRISADGATMAYVTDHEPFWYCPSQTLSHPGDQRHIEFLHGADLVVHDAQYTKDEYAAKVGWGHSPADYVTDVAMAAQVGRVVLFHHDPTHDDTAIKRIEDTQRARVTAAGGTVEVIAGAEGVTFDVVGKGWGKTIVDLSALELRPITGGQVLIVTGHRTDVSALEQVLHEDGLVLTSTADGRSALEMAAAGAPDLVIIDSKLDDGEGSRFIEPLRDLLAKPDLPIILLTEYAQGGDPLHTHEPSATDYVPRPFSAPMLRTRVRAWLARTMGATGTPVEIVLPPRVAPSNELADTHDIVRSQLDPLLSSMPLFAPLDRQQRTQLIERSSILQFPADHVIIRQDDPPDMVYALLAGHVRIVESMPDSPIQMPLGELGPGEVFGELGVLRDHPRSATVVTLERSQCLAIPAAEFLHLLGQSKEISLALLRILAARLFDADRLLARHAPDPLTGLHGRRAFHEMYRRLTAASKRRSMNVMLLVADVIHLKQINDLYGYSVGDDVLRTVADALVGCSRSSDLVARYGSDEFTLLLIEASARDAESIMNRVRRKVRELGEARGLPVPVECRMGFAYSDSPPESAEEFLRIADDHMQGVHAGRSK